MNYILHSLFLLCICYAPSFVADKVVCIFTIMIFGEEMEYQMAIKYIFVTGGVVSGLGKGITAASLGRLLKARGYKVTIQNLTHILTLTQVQ